METTQISLASLEIGKLEAIIETMLLAAYADGSLNEPERAEIERHIARLTDNRLGPDSTLSMLSHIERSVRAEGRAGRFKSIRERLPDVRMREAAIELAIRLIAVDGVIRDSEHALVVEAAQALGVPLAIKGRIVPI
jgi:tellurite resistance protein